MAKKGYEYGLEFLKRNGFPIVDDEENYIGFKYCGVYYRLWKYDAPFLQFALVCNTSNIERDLLLETANRLNEERFLTKMVILGPNDNGDNFLWAYAEMQVDDNTPDEFFTRALDVLNHDTDIFLQRLKE